MMTRNKRTNTGGYRLANSSGVRWGAFHNAPGSPSSGDLD
jgi:hypothetical protein